MIRATAYIDGSGNSARIQACAAVLRIAPQSEHSSGECHKRTKLLPPHTSNNVGEYNGLLLALTLAIECHIDELQIFSDSKLIVHQVRGEWKCKNSTLIPLRDKARSIAQIFRKVNIDWIPREKNKEADALCRQAIKAYEKTPNNPFLNSR